MTLDEIAIKHGCDKSSLKHDYCRIYEQYFKQIQPWFITAGKEFSLLEIGYGGYDDPDAGGESARMWAEAYPRINITITDIHPKNKVPRRVKFEQVDVTKLPDEIISGYGKHSVYDIIIDDGSHLNADIIAAFKNLWPVLNPGGLYCVEDVHSSYMDYYPDSSRVPGGDGTAMKFFTDLTHAVNRDFIEEMEHSWNDIGLYDIEFLHFYKELIIIKKKAA